jgi:hypothetical protein
METNAAAACRPIRCVIYTRKSSEEGLEQAFNSLDGRDRNTTRATLG